MSDCIEPSCSRYRGGASRGDKPRHVKRLNFGQSILELDVAEQRDCFATSRGIVVIQQNVAGIPCTERKDYVRKWIETHGGDGDCELSDDPSQSSPVLGTSATKACGTSPILGNSGKRSRERIRINRCAVARAKSVGNDVDCQEQSAGRPASCAAQRRPDCESKGGKGDEYLSTPPCAERMVADGSPVIGARLYRRKARRRKLQYKLEDCVSSKRLRLDDDNLTSTHVNQVAGFDGDLSALKELPALREIFDDALELEKVEGGVFPIEAEKSTERSQMCTAFSSKTQEKLTFEDSSNNNINIKLEVDTSDDSEDEECNKLSSTNDSSNNSLSNLIEEVDTQDMLPAANTSQLSAKTLLATRQLSKPSQLPADNSNETYCSEAEVMQDQSIHLSAQISLIPSLSKEATESKSTQTVVISTITTPSKTSLDKTAHAQLLDSGKKRRKPKKGSMVAKLQSLINAQVSSIRIWRHRMDKEDDAASARFIRVLVRDCSQQFGNQFLNGILIEDRFNLLRSEVEIEEAESRDVQAPPKTTAYRNVTIMLVRDIVGTLKMMSEVVMDVYPPWDILDRTDLTLEATHISINRDCEVPDISTGSDPRKREKRIVKEFTCPCIEQEREVQFCARKPNPDKPDVMQRIFDS